MQSRKVELKGLITELEELIPRLDQATQGSEFGQDAISKAKGTLENARTAFDAPVLSMVIESIDALTRTISLFKGVLERLK
jgi:molecular chaperone DnaK